MIFNPNAFSPKPRQQVLVEFIQDRSGSMGGDRWTEALNGFKVFVDNLKSGGEKDGIDYVLTLTMFDTEIATPYVRMPINNVDPAIMSQFGPRGGTALYDAVAHALMAELKLKNFGGYNFDKKICIIVTDGQENSSSFNTKDSVHTLIDQKLKEGNWTFQYMGVQPETWGDAQGIGIAVGAAATYNANQAIGTYFLLATSTNKLSANHLVRSAENLTTAYATSAELTSAGIVTAEDDQDVKVSLTSDPK